MVTEVDGSDVPTRDAPTRDDPVQPVVFISHGAPNILLRDNSFTRALQGIPATLPERPRGVVVFSRIAYPTYGSPQLVDAVEYAFAAAALPVRRHPGRGLDHGAWVPLRLMWPDDPPPVVQVSVDAFAPPAEQYAIGRSLADLRRDGVLIIGSGGTVHNLGIIEPEETPTRPWAVEFDDWLLENLARGDRDALFDYSRLAPHADRAVPRAENAANAAAPAGAATAQTGAGGTLAKVTVVDRSYLFGALSMLTLAFS